MDKTISLKTTGQCVHSDLIKNFNAKNKLQNYNHAPPFVLHMGIFVDVN